MMASAQMRALNLGINGGFPFNTPSNFCFSSYNFSISQCANPASTSNCIRVKKGSDFGRRKAEFSKAKFSIAFNSNGIKKSSNFDRREAKFSTVRALEKAEVDTHSTCVQIAERELNFSPTFQDYLQVMESVRTDRSKNPNVNMDVVSPKKRSAGKGDSNRHWENVNSRGGKLNHRGRDKDLKDKKNGVIKTRGSGWGLVERILVKKTSGNGGNHLKDANDDLNEVLHDARHAFDGEHVEKERYVMHKLKEQSRREARRVPKLMIPDQWKDPSERRSSERHSNSEMVGNSSERDFAKEVNHISKARESMECNKMKQNKLPKSDLEREMIGFEKDKNLINRTFIRSNTDMKLDESATKTSAQSSSFYRTSKKSGGSAGSKNEREDVMFLGIEQMKTKVNINGGERYVFEKEVGRQSSSRRKVEFQDDARGTDMLGSGAIEMQGTSTKSNTQLDTFDRGEIDWAPYAGPGDFGANMIIIIIMLFCALVLALALNAVIRYLLCSFRRSPPRPSDPKDALGRKSQASVPASIPVQVFSASTELAGAEADCAICLAEFADGDRVRVLPACNHGFHVSCVEKWLVSRSSCPTCRASCHVAEV